MFKVSFHTGRLDFVQNRRLLRARIRVVGDLNAWPICKEEDSNSSISRGSNKLDYARYGNRVVRLVEIN